MTMIEKVARAIAEAVSKNEQASNMWSETAKAAIEAMREPSEAMISIIDVTSGAVEQYQAMIDAALKE